MITYKFKYSNIEGLTRLDPEYYQPKYALKVNLIRNLNSKRLSKIFDISLGPAYPSSEITKNGELPIAKIGDVTNKRKPEDWDSLSSIAYNKFGSANIIKNDILITLTGDPPDVGKVHMPYTEFDLQEKVLAFNQRVGRLRTKELSPFFLYAALSSEYFRVRFEQCALGIRQRNVCIPDLKNAMVFLPDEEIIESISVKVKEHFKLSCLSKDLYTQATQLLNEALGLNDIQFKKEKNYKARLSEIIMRNRFDSEHFQPKYKQIKNQIRQFKYGWEPFLLNVRFQKPNIDPSKSPNKEFNYVELADINNTMGTINKITSIKAKDLPSRARRIVQTGDVIASSVVGSVEKAALVTEIENDYLASTGFFHFKSSYYSPEFLLMLVKNKLFKEQLFQESTGGILSAVPESNLLHVIIPKFPKDIQSEVTELVKQSQIQYRESNKLLEQAINEVEILIEQAAHQL